MKNIYLVFVFVVYSLVINAQNIFTVTKTTDPNPFQHPYNNVDSLCDAEMYGTLQWAIRKTNDATGTSIINFNIPGNGVKTINLNGYLPQIIKPVTIDATTQSGYVKGSPTVVLNGFNKMIEGFNFYNTTGIVVKGIGIKNFVERGIRIRYCSDVTISDCVIDGVHTNNDKVGIGISFYESTNATVTGNLIGFGLSTSNTGISHSGIATLENSHNINIGDTDINLQNTIKNCQQSGVFIGKTTYSNKISGNIFIDNTKAIFLTDNGNQQKTAPDSLVYYPDSMLLKGNAEPNDIIEIFGSTGDENANEYLTTVTADIFGKWEANITSTAFDYFVSTATDAVGNSSGLSTISSEETKLTQLISTDCGATNVDLDQILTAEVVFGANYYEFLVQNTSLNYSESIIKNTNSFKLEELGGIEYNRNYGIKVRTITGSDTTLFGNECFVQTKQDPLIYSNTGHSLYGIVTDTITGEPYKPSMYVYDRFGDSTLLENIKIPHNSEIAGIFRLHFIDEYNNTGHGFDDPSLGAQRKAVIVQVYKDLSELLRPSGVLPNPYPDYSGPDRYVEIEILESSVGMSPGVGGYASQWYLDVQNGITYGNVWEYINTGVDPYFLISNPNFPAVHSYHGYMKINFASFNFNISLNNPPSANQLDLYSIALHEAIHSLGFASLVSDDGTSRQTGTSPGRYSPWDTYLKVGVSQTSVLDFDTDVDCYNAEFNNSLNANDILGDCNNINMNFVYPGSNILNEVYTDINYNGGGSVFSHFNCTHTPNYVMNSSVSLGDYQRFPNIKEVQALCAIGYEISGTFGEGGAVLDFTDNSTTKTYPNACPSPRIVAGANDFGPYTTDMSVNLYTVEAGQSIDINDVTQNDYNTSEICCVEIVVGDGSITSTTPTGFTYQTGGTFAGEAVIKYRPKNSLGQRGNITYVFIQVEAPDLSPCVYSSLCNENIVCHGDFEECDDSLSGNDYYYSNFYLEGYTQNSTDIYTISGNTFFGISSWGIGESIVVKLTDPINNGETINISFNGSKDNNSPSNYVGDVSLELFAVQNGPCPIPSENSYTDGVATTSCPSFIPYSIGTIDITNDANGNYPNYISPNFIQYNIPAYTNNTGYEINYILIVPNNSVSSFVLIDDIVVTKEDNTQININSTINNTSLCPSDNFTINYEVCATGGIPTEPVTLVYSDEYGNIPTGITIEPSSDFDVNTGQVVIHPSDWNTGTGCVNLTLNLTVNGNALSGSSISNIINIEEGACISGSPVEDIVQIGVEDGLTIDKTVTVNGNIVTYNITVENIHSTNTFNNIVIEDIVPSLLSNISSSDFHETSPNHLVINTPFSLTSGNNITFTFTAELDANAPCELIENCAQITSADGICTLPIEDCTGFIPQSNVTASISNIISTGCNGSCTGSASVQVSNGVTPYVYQWNDPNNQTDETATDLCVGTYIVTVTDANNCTAEASATINIANFDAEVNYTEYICYGTNDGSATVNVIEGSGSYSYYWDDATHNQTHENLGVGLHSVNVIDDITGCSEMLVFEIYEYSEVLPKVSIEYLTCPGECSGEASVIGTGGTAPYSYSWSSGGNTDYENGLCVGNYTVTATDVNGCIGTADFEITESPQMYISTTSTNTCFGTNTGTAAVILNSGGTPPYTYLWNDANNQTTQTANNLFAGNYTVTVTDRNRCEVTESVTVGSYPEVTASFSNTNTCFGECNGTSTVSPTGSGTQPYTYLWNTSPQQTGQTATNLCAGSYTVTVTDVNSCETEFSTNIDQNDEIVLTTSSTNICVGSNTGTATVVASGGTPPYTYLWDEDANNQTTSTATGLGYGTYQVSVTDANNCTAVASVLVDAVPHVNSNYSITDCIVVGNSLSIDYTDAGGANSFTWEVSDGNTYSGQHPNIILNEPGYYCIKLTASSQCETETNEQIIFANPNQCSCDNNGNGFVIPNNTTYSSDATWNNNETIEGDVFVINGATLTIDNTTVNFGPKGRIIVENGSKLNIINSTLTGLNNCNNMWQGIEVWGNPYLDSDNSSQAVVNFQGVVNNIKNAHIAILLGKRNFSSICDNSIEIFDLSRAGGVLKNVSKRLNLTNNAIGVKYTEKHAPYDASHNELKQIYVSSTSLIDANYNIGAQNPYPNYANPWAGQANSLQRACLGFWIYQQKDLYIHDCSFDNVECAIQSYDSKYNVYFSTFKNAESGININSINPSISYGHKIYNNSFDKINTSIKILANNYDFIYDNTFGTPLSYQTDNNIGILADNASAFNFSENNFTNVQTGILVNNSNTNGGYIGAWNFGATSADYWDGNVFNNCKTNIFTQGNNSRLKLKCNMFYNNNNFDANIETYNQLANQGEPAITFSPVYSPFNQKRPAGNEFHPSNENDKRKIITHNNPYIYYHHKVATSEDYKVKPYVAPNYATILLSESNVRKSGNNIACSPIMAYPVVDDLHFEPLTGPSFIRLDSITNVRDSLINVYNNIKSNLDQGETEYLLNIINSNYSQYYLTSQLILHSPLSDTVLISAITRNNRPLGPVMFTITMMYNLPVSKKVEPYFLERVKTLPRIFKKYLSNLQAYNPYSNSPGLIEQKINIAEQKRVLYQNHLIALLNDSANKRKNDAILLLENDTSSKAQKTLVSTYIADTNYTSALSKLNGLTPANTYDADWIQLNQILINLFEQGKNLYQLSSNNLKFIRELATKCPAGLATANAQAILSLLYNEEYSTCPPVSADKSLSFNNNYYNNNNSNFYADPENEILGENYPDPADNYTIIPYSLPEGLNGIMQITGINGQVIAQYEIKSGKNFINFNTKNLSPGIYTYTVLIDGLPPITKKMIISR